jgi:hypothetical protein
MRITLTAIAASAVLMTAACTPTDCGGGVATTHHTVTHHHVVTHRHVTVRPARPRISLGKRR